MLVCALPAKASRPPNCGKLRPRAELRCARRQLAQARHAARVGTPHHSPGYWHWRERVARRWIRDAHRRLALPPAHSRFTPDPRAASFWTHRYFGYGSDYRLMMCVANTESRYELAATNGVNVGPTQVNLTAHPWVDGDLIRHSWKYAMAVSWRLSGSGTDFHAWAGDCGL